VRDSSIKIECLGCRSIISTAITFISFKQQSTHSTLLSPIPFTKSNIMRFFAITSILALSVSALPTADNSVIARDASPEAIADALVESAARLQARDKDIAYASMPTKSAACPATARYGAHTYTDNQIKVAFLGGCGLNAKGKQLGTSKVTSPQS
jgi:hypothetical protein